MLENRGDASGCLVGDEKVGSVTANGCLPNTLTSSLWPKHITTHSVIYPRNPPTSHPHPSMNYVTPLPPT